VLALPCAQPSRAKIDGSGGFIKFPYELMLIVAAISSTVAFVTDLIPLAITVQRGKA
jgi:hypothetical protein